MVKIHLFESREKRVAQFQVRLSVEATT
jgi:hypothetical protein